MNPVEFDEAASSNAAALIEMAFAEDMGDAGDITAEATIPILARGSARFVARREGVIAGLPVVALAARRLRIRMISTYVRDGDRVAPGDKVADIVWDLRAILALERTALNFLQRMSGIATLTARFVAEVAGTGAQILDTRKTTPGWRALEKYAVRCGGGTNHRMGLHDGILIKDNHLAFLSSQSDPICTERDPITRAVTAARTHAPEGAVVEVEVDTFDQLGRALACAPDIILVDNFDLASLSRAVQMRNDRAPGILLEASGGITLETVGAIARTGVDRISVGALTHSAGALDIALDYWHPGSSNPEPT